LWWAKLEDEDGKVGGQESIHGFIRERHEGPERRRSKMSLRASITGEIVMDDVCADENLPNVNGSKGPAALNKARYGARGALGAAEDCWFRASVHDGPRAVWPSLAQNQLIQKKLADMQTEITPGSAGLPAVGRLMDEDKRSEMINLIKRNSCGKVLDIARLARDMHGGNGIHDDTTSSAT
jgi:glutaryl-CoA dehydrogenase